MHALHTHTYMHAGNKRTHLLDIQQEEQLLVEHDNQLVKTK